MQKTTIKTLGIKLCFIAASTWLLFSCSEEDEVTPVTNLSLEATASASSTYYGYSADNINDGDTNTEVGPKSSWTNSNSSTDSGKLPQWVMLDFGTEKSFSRIELYTSEDYLIQDYQLQYFDGVAWQTIEDVTDNTFLIRSHTFDKIISSKVRLYGTKGPDNQSVYVRVNELEVWTE
ncbi:discoidin domain-containing protein [Chondrinema litorale]|uniref:discoidin domain-containing protein n=1 Tax=Chondrinema litorale TaxID=2994555 RepID=UPI002542D9DE|nr:discoidin domain-containing protein [Chondrinema litorale]UZR95293.1 discoidin domain-containing protein [Chondrinema litorale]